MTVALAFLGFRVTSAIEEIWKIDACWPLDVDPAEVCADGVGRPAVWANCSYGHGPTWVQFNWLVDVNPADACAQRIGVSFWYECSYVGTGTRSRGVCACYRRSNKTCSNEDWCRRDSSQSGNPHGPHPYIRPRIESDAAGPTVRLRAAQSLRPARRIQPRTLRSTGGDGGGRTVHRLCVRVHPQVNRTVRGPTRG